MDGWTDWLKGWDWSDNESFSRAKKYLRCSSTINLFKDFFKTLFQRFQRLSQETLYICRLTYLYSYSELIRKLQFSILFWYTVIKKPITWDKSEIVKKKMYRLANVQTNDIFPRLEPLAPYSIQPGDCKTSLFPVSSLSSPHTTGLFLIFVQAYHLPLHFLFSRKITQSPL